MLLLIDRNASCDIQRVSGQSPPDREKGIARSFGAVHCVVGDDLLSAVNFLASCFMARGFVGWRIAAYAHAVTF
jgi:hypothetical protein